MCSVQFLVATTTTTHALLPKGRHTAARQRVKAARQFSGWSPAARLSRSLRFLLTPPMRGPRVFLAPHKWLAKLFVMPPTLPSPCHSTWPNTTPAGLPATRYSHFPRLSLTPLMRGPRVFLAPLYRLESVILYRKKKSTSSSRSPPGRAPPPAHSAVQLAEASPGPFA